MSERSVNKIILVGRVGRDPEIRTTQSGTRVATFTLATNRRDDEADWHRITAWDKLADIVDQYVGKGERLYIEGRVQYSEKDGKWYTDVVAREMVMLGDGGQKKEASESAPAAAPYTGPTYDNPADSDLPF